MCPQVDQVFSMQADYQQLADLSAAEQNIVQHSIYFNSISKYKNITES